MSYVQSMLVWIERGRDVAHAVEHCCKGLDPPACRIDPALWKQFGLFSVPTIRPSKVVVGAALSVVKCI